MCITDFDLFACREGTKDRQGILVGSDSKWFIIMFLSEAVFFLQNLKYESCYTESVSLTIHELFAETIILCIQRLPKFTFLLENNNQHSSFNKDMHAAVCTMCWLAAHRKG